MTTTPDDEPELLLNKRAATFMVPQELLDDYAGFGDISDVLRRALNGEQVFNPPAPPRRHRCLFCWLVSKLPGHERCDHGRMGCDDCYRDD